MDKEQKTIEQRNALNLGAAIQAMGAKNCGGGWRKLVPRPQELLTSEQNPRNDKATGRAFGGLEDSFLRE